MGSRRSLKVPLPVRLLFGRIVRPLVWIDRGFARGIDLGASLAMRLVRVWQRWGLPRASRVARWAAARGRRLAFFLGPLLARMASRVPWSCALGVVATGCAAAAIAVWRFGESLILVHVVGVVSDQAGTLPALGLEPSLMATSSLAGVLSFLVAAAALAAFARTRFSLWVLKAAAAGSMVFGLVLLGLAWRIPAELNRADSALYQSADRNEMWVHGTVRVGPLVVLAAIFMFLLALKSVTAFYHGRLPLRDMVGDRIWRNLRTHGKDPGYRKAFYRSLFIHVFVIFVLPFLLAVRGCERPYGVPKGSGSPVLEMVRIKKIKVKQQKKYVLNMNTAISFYIPKIDDSQVLEEVDKLTENIYEAQQEKSGKLGAGGGKSGGWPNGMEKAQVRFIRLEYDGGDWDQDMGYGADYNMLVEFRKITGFNIAPRTESIRIPQLLRFPRKRAPPFVYLTGGLKGSIGVTQSDAKALRKYCLELGGMIFADNGGGNFDAGFRGLMRRAFPELPLVEIPHDDVIFQQPFYFPNGAPPLWHHSGNQALGVKSSGRWVVFYHQGDINDAWKDGHSGASENLSSQAYKMGINVINYGFNQYMMLNHGDR